MNGRTYDTRLGRFMQADIVIQSPFDTQSYNRYSYLTNNPLNGTDPSGYFSRRDLKEYAGVIVGGALLAWNPLGYGIWQSAVYGAIAGGSGAAVNGGNVLQGVAIGAFSAAAFAGFDGAGFGWGAAGNVGQHALNIAASGVLGGAITVMQGGKFGHGFASAGVSAAAVGGMNGAGIKGPARVIGAAIAGGTASVVSGGKFANGALTAAFQAAASEVASSNDGLAEGSGSDDESWSTEMPDWEGDPDVVSAQGSIWSGSRTDLPPNQRMEQGGWVVHRWFAADGDYDVIRVSPGLPHRQPWMGTKPSPLTCFCTVKGSIHSHPLRYSDGPWDPYRPSSADLSHSKQFRIPGVIITFPRPTDNIYQVIPYKGW